MEITFYKVSFVDGTLARVESGITSADAANKRAEVLRSRGKREVRVTSYVEAGRDVPSVRPCPWSDRLARSY